MIVRLGRQVVYRWFMGILFSGGNQVMDGRGQGHETGGRGGKVAEKLYVAWDIGGRGSRKGHGAGGRGFRGSGIGNVDWCRLWRGTGSVGGGGYIPQCRTKGKLQPLKGDHSQWQWVIGIQFKYRGG